MDYYNPYMQMSYPFQMQGLNPTQRLQQMEQRYPQFAQQPQQPQGIPCTVVTCIDEAKSAQVSLDGTPNIFLDTSKNHMYLKQINLNGTADFIVFDKVNNTNENNTPEQSQPDTITREEFISTMSILTDEVKSISEKIKIFME